MEFNPLREDSIHVGLDRVIIRLDTPAELSDEDYQTFWEILGRGVRRAALRRLGQAPPESSGEELGSEGGER